MSDHDAPIDLATDERSQADREAEWERAIAGQRSYLGASVVVFLLYWLFFIPGFVFNCLFLNAALKDARKAGRLPSGIGCLGIMFLIGMIPAFVFASCVGLVGTGAAVALADSSDVETSYSVRRVHTRSAPSPRPAPRRFGMWSNLHQNTAYEMPFGFEFRTAVGFGSVDIPEGGVIVTHSNNDGLINNVYYITAFDASGRMIGVGRLSGLTDTDEKPLEVEPPVLPRVDTAVRGQSFRLRRRFEYAEGWPTDRPRHDAGDWAQIIAVDNSTIVPRVQLEIRSSSNYSLGDGWVLWPAVEDQLRR